MILKNKNTLEMQKYIKIILLTFLATILSGCSGPTDDYTNQNKIIVATSADNPPYEFIKNGEVVGLDIDIIKAIGEVLNKEIVIKNMDFPGLLPALTTGTVDAVIAGITVTEARKEKVDFSRGYVSTAMEIMFKSEDKFQKIDDFADKNIGVQTGTTWELYAKSLQARFPSLQITSLPNNLVLVETLKNGNIDAIIMEEMQVIKFKQKNPDLNSLELEDTKGEFAIATQKGSGLAEIVNRAIDQLQLEGKLFPIKTKWLSK